MMMGNISEAIASLFQKLQRIDINTLDISSYNKKYLKIYLGNYSFFMCLYAQLMQKATAYLHKSVNEATFIDYGGGCGILSYMAREMGFRTIVYNDIYDTSVQDAKIIAGSLNMHIDYFIKGDAEALVTEITSLKLQPDLICSFDVLEHIYDWKTWIDSILKISQPFSLVFMTSANGANPLISRRLKKIQLQAEHSGFAKDEGWKPIDLYHPFLAERQKIILDAFPGLNATDATMLATKSRGLIKKDIESLAVNFMETQKINYTINHPTNTCDPYTGNWTEHIINTKELKDFAESRNVEVDITNATYGYGHSVFQNVIKFGMNMFIKLFGRHSLWLSPVYVLELNKKQT